ncbi:MAG: hypothetical protein ACK4IX_14890 [Candidatus Sericytochromatia bacterium]
MTKNKIIILSTSLFFFLLFSIISMYSFYSKEVSQEDLYKEDAYDDFISREDSKTFNTKEIKDIKALIDMQEFVKLEDKIRTFYYKTNNEHKRNVLVKLLARLNDVKTNKIDFFVMLKELEKSENITDSSLQKLIHVCIFSYLSEKGTFPKDVIDRDSFIKLISENCNINYADSKIRGFKLYSDNEDYKFTITFDDNKTFTYTPNGYQENTF